MLVNALRHSLVGLRMLVVLTVVLGVAYPLALTGLGQLAFPHQANGSMVQLGGRDVGSSLIGQDIEGPQWFHPRPSAVRYDAMASGGSNLGPSSSALADEIARRRARIAKQNGVPPSEVPPDALTASGSGLDPDISPAYAELQVARVARARGMSVVEVRRLVAEHTQGRILGFLGEPRVDVLELDLALAAISRTARVTR